MSATTSPYLTGRPRSAVISIRPAVHVTTSSERRFTGYAPFRRHSTSMAPVASTLMAPTSSNLMAGIFEPFFSGDVRDSRQELGLGLHIASQIAKAHGGKIDVTSSAQETRSVFTMPEADADNPCHPSVSCWLNIPRRNAAAASRKLKLRRDERWQS